MSKCGYVYILASKKNGTLYVGVTSNIHKRVWQHRSSSHLSFTKRYDVHLLVYVERHDSIATAIKREKNIKAWKRAWKLRLIEKDNPDWNDLYTVKYLGW